MKSKSILILLALVSLTFNQCRKRRAASNSNNRIFIQFDNSTFATGCSFNLEEYKNGQGKNNFDLSFSRLELDQNGNVNEVPIQTFSSNSFVANNSVGSLFIPVPKSGDFGIRVVLTSENCKSCCATSCSPRAGGRPMFEQIITKWTIFKDDATFKIKFSKAPKCICPGCKPI